MTLTGGERAPEFALKNQHGQSVRLSELLENDPVMLVFVPLAFSATCTDEIATLEREKQQFVAAGIKLVIASVDSTASLRAWADAGGYSLEFLSDFWPHGATARAFGALIEDKGFAARASFLIDRSAIVRSAFEAPLGEPREFSDYEHAISLTQLAEWS